MNNYVPPKPIIKKVKLFENKPEVIIETGKLAKQADGSVVVRMGKTMLLATVVSAQEPRPDVDFLPLQVEYQEKFSSYGRFPGGFFKREGKPSEHEILVARLVDRAIRPLFPKDYRNDTFVIVQLISADKEVMPDSLAGLAASAAIMVSDIPFDGPMAEVRVSRIDGKFVINPSFEENERADIDLMVGGTEDSIVMVEGEMNEVSEEEMLEAIKTAHEYIKVLCRAQKELEQEAGTTEKRDYPREPQDPEFEKFVSDFAKEKIEKVAKSFIADKHKRKEEFNKIKDELVEYVENRMELDEEEKELKIKLVDIYFHDLMKHVIREMILEEGIRVDGRKLDEIRPIWCEVDYLPSAHGSAIFARGETMSLTTVTLGSKLDEQVIDEVLIQSRERFVLHYNFPPFATGDARPVRGISRREIGHGNLAHRALKRMIPPEEQCPYTIRVVSDILESNGSSSMATVCAGTLALMDAGIKIKKPVSGIAMGLVTDQETGRWAVLSDILGDEDHLGDMDFKVTGTRDGLTACQMDIKIEGLNYEILAKALEQSKKGRLYILDKMLETMPEPRENFKPHAPKIARLEIPADMIGALIGPGGKVIQKLQADTDTTVVVEPEEDKGIVTITANDEDGFKKAVDFVKRFSQRPEVGQVYTGIVKEIHQNWAIVEFIPGITGLLHKSQIDYKYVTDINDYISVGDEIKVKLIEYNKDEGTVRLSMKALMPPPDDYDPQNDQRRHNRSGDGRRTSGHSRQGRPRHPRSNDNRPPKED